MLTSLVVDNWYVGIPLVLGLMLLDALLTQLGYKFYLKYGKQHVELEHYELSPYWQKDVEEKGRIFSVRYILLLVIGGAGLGVVYAFGSRLVVEILVGLYCGVFITINLTHLNGLLFYYARSKIDGAVEGKLKYSYKFSTVSSAISNLTFGLLLGFLLLFTEAGAFAVAFVAGPFY